MPQGATRLLKERVVLQAVMPVLLRDISILQVAISAALLKDIVTSQAVFTVLLRDKAIAQLN